MSEIKETVETPKKTTKKTTTKKTATKKEEVTPTPHNEVDMMKAQMDALMQMMAQQHALINNKHQ